MKGVVDGSGRALVKIRVRPTAESEPTAIDAWIDTAFTGELVLPSTIVDVLELPQSAGVTAGLANGRQVTLETFSCLIEWFNEDRPIEVIANEGQHPLLGVGLLIGRKLTVDYRKLTVALA